MAEVESTVLMRPSNAKRMRICVCLFTVYSNEDRLSAVQSAVIDNDHIHLVVSLVSTCLEWEKRILS